MCWLCRIKKPKRCIDYIKTQRNIFAISNNDHILLNANDIMQQIFLKFEIRNTTAYIMSNVIDLPVISLQLNQLCAPHNNVLV